MTGAFVVDASIAVAWVHPGQRTASSEDMLDAVARGAVAHAPSIWPIEVSNALLVLSRRGKLREEKRQAGLALLASLSVTVDQEGAGLAWRTLPELAVTHTLSVYDAAYLELALRRRLVLASKDGPLRRAAVAAGVQIWE